MLFCNFYNSNDDSCCCCFFDRRTDVGVLISTLRLDSNTFSGTTTGATGTVVAGCDAQEGAGIVGGFKLIFGGSVVVG